ncbi:MAG: hypothetical protein M3O33_12270, partial [Cyanobacteriota bacterium]|nr:hypothetical protein [Cyanobacteriota bacterium]
MQSVLHHKAQSELERLHKKGKESHVVSFCCSPTMHQKRENTARRRGTDSQSDQSQLQAALKTFRQALA